MKKTIYKHFGQEGKASGFVKLQNLPFFCILQVMTELIPEKPLFL